MEERRIGIDEVIRRSEDGTLREAFGAGTAAVITPIGRIGFEGKMHEINAGASGPLGAELYDALIGIQLGEREDRHGWNRIVDLDIRPRPGRGLTAAESRRAHRAIEHNSIVPKE